MSSNGGKQMRVEWFSRLLLSSKRRDSTPGRSKSAQKSGQPVLLSPSDFSACLVRQTCGASLTSNESSKKKLPHKDLVFFQ